MVATVLTMHDLVSRASQEVSLVAFIILPFLESAVLEGCALAVENLLVSALWPNLTEGHELLGDVFGCCLELRRTLQGSRDQIVPSGTEELE